MALTFINAAHYDNASSTDCGINKPTNTADNDIMFAFIKRIGTTDPSTVPTGWALLGKGTDVDSDSGYWLYWKLAASEGASYTWSWAAAARTGGTIVTYRDGFNTADPIDVVSNTGYLTSNTTVRAASMTVGATGSPLLFFGGTHNSAAQTFTKPSVPTTDWVEDVDQDGSTPGSRFIREICSMVWSGSGATGDMDATASVTTTTKHAFAVALNPASAASAAVTGTATASITESDVVTGGKTLIITLSGDSFIA
jgi:hypothetical protein